MHIDIHTGLDSPKGNWWKPAHRAEKTWVVIAFAWCMVLFAMMPLWHWKGGQNPSGIRRRVEPAEFYKRTIELGLSWLVSHQGQNGNLLVGSNMYAHGLASITLCEAYALSKDSRLGLAAQAAVRFIEDSPNRDTGGWHYSPKPETIGDTSIVGWQVMALKSAQMAGLDVNPATLARNSSWAALTARSSRDFSSASSSA